MIEKGRYLNQAKFDRKCPFCPNVEDETHFLLHCQTFRVLRENMLEAVREKLRDILCKIQADPEC